jgi:hypothetical protein
VNENGAFKELFTRNQFTVCKEKLCNKEDIFSTKIWVRTQQLLPILTAEARVISAVIVLKNVKHCDVFVSVMACFAVQNVTVVALAISDYVLHYLLTFLFLNIHVHDNVTSVKTHNISLFVFVRENYQFPTFNAFFVCCRH